MIPVTRQAEPAEFGNRVRRPGRAFLRRNPPPTTIQVRANNLWKRCHDDLYYLYDGICAYSSQWTPRTKAPSNIEQQQSQRKCYGPVHDTARLVCHKFSYLSGKTK